MMAFARTGPSEARLDDAEGLVLVAMRAFERNEGFAIVGIGLADEVFAELR